MGFINYLLPITYYLLPITNYLLPIQKAFELVIGIGKWTLLTKASIYASTVANIFLHKCDTKVDFENAAKA